VLLRIAELHPVDVAQSPSWQIEAAAQTGCGVQSERKNIAKNKTGFGRDMGKTSR
jgi:hypothetical protein